MWVEGEVVLPEQRLALVVAAPRVNCWCAPGLCGLPVQQWKAERPRVEVEVPAAQQMEAAVGVQQG
jgi:hypothetical protein